MSWFLNFIYTLLFIAATPWLAWRMAVQGKNCDGWGQKLLGLAPACDAGRDRVWFHAVSVGEVLQLQSVVTELLARRPHADIVISTTTSTGRAVAREKFPAHTVFYFPFDFSWAVRRAIRRVKPTVIVLVELELWPNLILTAAALKVPLTLVNGRVSENSFRGYRRIRFLLARLLPKFSTIAVQSETYRRRLLELGAPEDIVRVTGSIKFDGVTTNRDNAATRALRASFGIQPEETVFIAGSTQDPEESLALETWATLRDEHPRLRLILVPRHKERFEEVARLVSSRGYSLLRRTDAKAGKSAFTHGPPPVLLLDTLGELAACWGLADIAFVGGSLTNRGGQNMIEPAAYGAAVLFGPNTKNFRDVVEMLLNEDAATVVEDGGALTANVARLLNHREAARRQGAVAKRLVLSQQGATSSTIDLLIQHLPSELRQRAA